MKYLRDTHVWMWSLLAAHQLEEHTRIELANPHNILYLSPISIWEAHLLIEKGRLHVSVAPQVWLEEARRRSPVVQAPLTFPVALRSRQVHLPHQDPADRFITATAIEYGLTLMTADQDLLTAGQVTTWRVGQV